MKNVDASQTRCSNQTKMQCTSVSDLTKYTCTLSHAPTASQALKLYPMIPRVLSLVTCLVNVSGAEIVLNPPEVEPQSKTFFFPASPCAEK